MTALTEWGTSKSYLRRLRGGRVSKNREEALTAVSTAQVIKPLESSRPEQLGYICLSSEFSTDPEQSRPCGGPQHFCQLCSPTRG